MPLTTAPPLKPRKLPVQARSEATVTALLDAGIQVLTAVGYRKLTTTRVADRAGVSVGTLYQYFPNGHALVAGVVGRYLSGMFAAIEADCRKLAGAPVEVMATAIVDALIAAKWKRIEVSRAMHEPLADVGGAGMVQASALKGAKLISELLSTCPDAEWDDVGAVALFVVMSSTSLMQTAIAGPARSIDRETLRVHLRAAVLGYLNETKKQNQTPSFSRPAKDRRR